MGKIFFSKEQKTIFDQVTKSTYLKSNFYFTGGAALSYFYLQHRYSEDEVKLWAKKFDFTFQHQFKEVVNIFTINFKNKITLKVDFGYYPHRRVGKGISYQGISIDSQLDIAINKLASVNQRSQVKDFVDLYFLLDKFLIWDLIEDVKVKFRMELEPWILASDLEYYIYQFKYLPKMIKPLTLNGLKKFFRNQAIILGRKAVES